MTAMIESKYATLETLAVTVQALHVSGKQLTLAVFRQLPVQSETDDAELWGIVRYAIKDEGDLWLTFSLNGSLYRRRLNPVRDPYMNTRRERHALVEAQKTLDSAQKGMEREQSLLAGARCKSEQATTDHDHYRRYVRDCEQAVTEATKKIVKAEELRQEAEDALMAAATEVDIEAVRADHHASLLKELPQLFIAV